MMQLYIKRVLYGFLMGFAEVVPGVSGSAIALMLGFYKEIVNILFNVTEVIKISLKFFLRKASFQNLLQQVMKFNFPFAVPLGLGVLLAGAIMPTVVLHLFEKYPAYSYSALFGLAISVTFVPLKEMKSKSLVNFFIALVTFIIAFVVLGLEPAIDESGRPSALLLFVGGVLGITGMILPALSGGFILIVMGLYYYLVDIARDIVHLRVQLSQLLDLAIFSAGAAIGFITVARGLKLMFDRHREKLMAMILGLVVASYRVVWPFVENSGGSGEFAVKKVPISNFSSTEIVAIAGIVAITALVLTVITNKYSAEE